MDGTHNTEWLDVILDGRMVQINANGDIREIDDDKPKNQIGFRASDNGLGSPTDGILPKSGDKGTSESRPEGKPESIDGFKGTES